MRRRRTAGGLLAAGLALLLAGCAGGSVGDFDETPLTSGPVLRAGFDAEFLVRPDGYPGLRATYGLEFAAEPEKIGPRAMYEALAARTVDVICGFSTDARIAAYDLVALRDDRAFFPAYDAAPLVRAQTLKKHPQLEALLGRLAGTLSAETMCRLNHEVDRGEGARAPRDVAREFLLARKLIAPDAGPGDGSAGTIAVGGKNFTEQDILVEMTAILIESSANIRVERKASMAGTLDCFQAIRGGDLDVYAEYAGTALVILERDLVSSPAKAHAIVRAEMKKRFDLAWLEPFGFSNSYALVMRRADAEALGIRTISDLARYNRRRSAGGER